LDFRHWLNNGELTGDFQVLLALPEAKKIILILILNDDLRYGT